MSTSTPWFSPLEIEIARYLLSRPQEWIEREDLDFYFERVQGTGLPAVSSRPRKIGRSLAKFEYQRLIERSGTSPRPLRVTDPRALAEKLLSEVGRRAI